MDEVRRPAAEDALSRLSEGQLACLRLVMDGRTSKEIAKTLAISPHTVDQRLRLAIQILNVTSRFEAARMVRATDGHSEADGRYQRSQRAVYQPDRIAEEAERRLAETQDDGVPDQNRDASEMDDRETIPFEQAAAPDAGSSTSREMRSGVRNGLRPMLRITIVIGLMIGVALTLSILITVAEGLARLFKGTFN